MKNSLFKHIPCFLLAVFLFTFTFQNISIVLGDTYIISIADLIAGKHIKTIHTPNQEGSTSDESPIEENESKDEKEKESETKFHSELAIIFFAQSVFSQGPGNESLLGSQHSLYAHKTQCPLYLLTRTFRI